MSSNWLGDHYLYLNKYWDHLKKLTLANALKWASQERTRSISSEQIRLLGTAIRARYVEIIRPVALLCVVLYLSMHLSHIAGELTTQERAEDRRRCILCVNCD